MIEVDTLCKYYGARAAVEQVSFSINKGEIIGLLGLNGAGKSTVLKVLCGFLLPSAGNVSVNGYSVEDEPQGVRRSIGFLPDVPPLYREMTVSTYLDYVLRLKVGKITKSKAQQYLEEALQKAGIAEVRHRCLGELSHGYGQRVGIAQAIVHQPPVLLLDEPINGLDPVQIVEMRDMIISLRQEHTVVLSSHILSEITQTCDRILILDAGKLVAQGTAEHLTQQAQQGMSYQCETKTPPVAVLTEIEALTGVRQVACQRTTSGTHRVVIQAETDVRPLVARLLCDYDLLTLAEESSGLESLFKHFVQVGRHT